MIKRSAIFHRLCIDYHAGTVKNGFSVKGRNDPRMTLAGTVVVMWRWRWAMTAVLVIAITIGFFAVHIRTQENLRHRLLATSPFQVVDYPDLVRFAMHEAGPLYATHCASCHGADMHGNSSIGAPNLIDSVWLYGDGSVFQIERVILFGIRDGSGKTLDVTEMPAFGQRGLLKPTQIRDVVQYVLERSHQPHLTEAAQAGHDVFEGPIGCYDCHGQDAKGVADYGAPNLTADVWNWGGTPDELYNSIYYGRHGIMPGWLGRLDLEQIRALAVDIHALASKQPSHTKFVQTNGGGE